MGVFALMFVLELPDKTFLATVIMSTKARPLMVAFGVLTVDTMFLRSSVSSVERTVANCDGW